MPLASPHEEKVSLEAQCASVQTEDVGGGSEPRILMAKLKLLKEKQKIEQDRIALQSRSEQLLVKMQLGEMGYIDRSKFEPLLVSNPCRAEPSSGAEEALSSFLPPAQVKPFSGNIEEFRLFMNSFESRIASRTDDSAELVSYLEQYKTGEAYQLV